MPFRANAHFAQVPRLHLDFLSAPIHFRAYLPRPSTREPLQRLRQCRPDYRCLCCTVDRGTLGTVERCAHGLGSTSQCDRSNRMEYPQEAEDAASADNIRSVIACACTDGKCSTDKSLNSSRTRIGCHLPKRLRNSYKACACLFLNQTDVEKSGWPQSTTVRLCISEPLATRTSHHMATRIARPRTYGATKAGKIGH